jgi:hypothetical protein
MSMLLVLLVSYANLVGTFSAPVPSLPNAQETTHWVSASMTQGTFNLLASCVITLFLCLWTSFHLNVPGKNENTAAHLARKLVWMLLALFAPELIVYTAWRQWVSAKMLCMEINKVFDVCLSFPA